MNNNTPRWLIFLLGSLSAIVLLIIIICFFNFHDYEQVFILNSNKTIMASDSIYTMTSSDSLKIVSAKVKLLQEMESKGILLTPQEYTSQISGFYSTIITFLIALFVVFTFIGYYSIRMFAKSDIKKIIDELIDDSIEFNERTTNAIKTKIVADFVPNEEFEDYKKEQKETIRVINEKINADSVTTGDEQIITPQ